MRKRVWFNKASAVLWALAGIAAFPLGWAYSVAFVTIASIYANVKTDWGTAEAADDRPIMAELKKLRAEVRELRELIENK